MTPDEVKEYYKSYYNFNKATGMSSCSLLNWCKWGFVPIPSQQKLEKMTQGQLITNWHRSGVNDE